MANTLLSVQLFPVNTVSGVSITADHFVDTLPREKYVCLLQCSSQATPGQTQMHEGDCGHGWSHTVVSGAQY